MVKNNIAQRRYELAEKGELAFADYRLHNGILTLLHVEAAPALQGTGAAGRLMEGIVHDARAKNYKIKPACPYAAHWLQKHPEAGDVLA